MSGPSLEVSLLQDGAQTAESVAAQLASFVSGAERTLEIAIYDLNLTGAPADEVRAAIRAAAARQVVVRMIYNVDHPYPIPVPPPPETDTAFIESLGVPTRAVAGVPSLMHHKYAVRDPDGANAAVWTGSTNWTNDSWTREENVILRLPSAAVAAEYRRNFEELWSSAEVDDSGKYDLPAVTVPLNGQPIRTRVYFSPGRGRQMSHAIASRLAQARRRIRLCSPVITSGVVLGTLGDLAHHPRLDFKGVYDRTQMEEVLRQWSVDPHAGWKAPAFTAITSALPFASKVTIPYAPGSIHNFMHAKVTVVDDVVLTGSYNLSHSGEENAENLLELNSAPLADLLAGFVDELFARYAATTMPAPK